MPRSSDTSRHKLREHERETVRLNSVATSDSFDAPPHLTTTGRLNRVPFHLSLQGLGRMPWASSLRCPTLGKISPILAHPMYTHWCTNKYQIREDTFRSHSTRDVR